MKEFSINENEKSDVQKYKEFYSSRKRNLEGVKKDLIRSAKTPDRIVNVDGIGKIEEFANIINLINNFKKQIIEMKPLFDKIEGGNEYLDRYGELIKDVKNIEELYMNQIERVLREDKLSEEAKDRLSKIHDELLEN